MQNTNQNQHIYDLIVSKDIHNIEELIILFNELKNFKPAKVKPYLDSSVIKKIFENFTLDEIKEVLHSYLSEHGKIEPSIYLNIFARQFSSLTNIQMHLDYFKQYPVENFKQVEFLCFKTMNIYQDDNNDTKKLDDFYLQLQIEKTSLFNAAFFKKIINSEHFLTKVGIAEYQNKFLKLHVATMSTFIENNPEWIEKHKKVKVLNFLLLAGYKDVLINNKDFAQKMIINFLTSSHPAQANVILKVIPLDSVHLKKLLNIIETKEEKHYSEESIYHPIQINKIRMRYEKSLLDEVVDMPNNNTLSRKIKL